MNFDQFELQKRFEKIESKKITKKLLNEYKYLNFFLLSSIILLVLLVFLFISYLINQNTIYGNLISIALGLYFILFITFFIMMNNSKFNQLSNPDRQFYILYLIREHLKTDFTLNKYKLWSLIGSYCKELYKVESWQRNYSIFEISNEEKIIFTLRNSINRKIKGQIIAGNNDKAIFEIFDRLITINYIKNLSDNIFERKERNENIKKNLLLIDSIFEGLEMSTETIDILKINWIVNRLKIIDFNVIIVCLSTVLVTTLYIVVTKLNNEIVNIGILFEIILMTPGVVLLFLNLIRNKKNDV